MSMSMGSTTTLSSMFDAASIGGSSYAPTAATSFAPEFASPRSSVYSLASASACSSSYGFPSPPSMYMSPLSSSSSGLSSPESPISPTSPPANAPPWPIAFPPDEDDLAEQLASSNIHSGTSTPRARTSTLPTLYEDKERLHPYAGVHRAGAPAVRRKALGEKRYGGSGLAAHNGNVPNVV
ncbi:hypothetical protein POSPLADRAFT_1073965 [Postia placenta MAD-698-R-SB12]|uniref:Uncharacterized protein n=1 Tax=Postia placenta MAD-698-R-SB12 TaxID=670580 RepID=A0A1X6N3J7_9APHY|nr:hypothetical protein POSPLADRAFT_1073965 [Postia placenta MAD-698-R-SB12]OSX63178.1 hypothetical protein POSPLADRAFT_1073965 [Postia placenta MAD-698-R-SB12]